jgi:hypothetical protein
MKKTRGRYMCVYINGGKLLKQMCMDTSSGIQDKSGTIQYITTHAENHWRYTTYYHVFEWLQMSFELVNGFTDHWHIWHRTTINYSATANLRSSQITTALAKPFSSLLCLHQPFLGNGFKKWRSLSFSCSRPLFSASRAQLTKLTKLQTSRL